MVDSYTAPDFAAAALVSIDAQRDVLDGGTLGVAGTSNAMTAIGALTASFRAAGRPIVHMVRLYRPDASNVDLCRRSSVQAGARTLIAGTPGSQLAAELARSAEGALDHELLLGGAPQVLGENEVAIYKPRWGAFYDTPLHGHLERLAVDTLVFCGCNFPNCPRTSIYQASERDYRLVVVRDAISGMYERGERELQGIGVQLIEAREVAELLRDALAPAAVG